MVIYSPNKGRTYFDQSRESPVVSKNWSTYATASARAIQEIAPLGVAAGERYNAARLGLLNG